MSAVRVTTVKWSTADNQAKFTELARAVEGVRAAHQRAKMSDDPPEDPRRVIKGLSKRAG
jgi:hypothetical protein